MVAVTKRQLSYLKSLFYWKGVIELRQYNGLIIKQWQPLTMVISNNKLELFPLSVENSNILSNSSSRNIVDESVKASEKINVNTLTNHPRENVSPSRNSEAFEAIYTCVLNDILGISIDTFNPSLNCTKANPTMSSITFQSPIRFRRQSLDLHCSCDRNHECIESSVVANHWLIQEGSFCIGWEIDIKLKIVDVKDSVSLHRSPTSNTAVSTFASPTYVNSSPLINIVSSVSNSITASSRTSISSACSPKIISIQSSHNENIDITNIGVNDILNNDPLPNKVSKHQRSDNKLLKKDSIDVGSFSFNSQSSSKQTRLRLDSMSSLFSSTTIVKNRFKSTPQLKKFHFRFVDKIDSTVSSTGRQIDYTAGIRTIRNIHTENRGVTKARRFPETLSGLLSLFRLYSDNTIEITLDENVDLNFVNNPNTGAPDTTDGNTAVNCDLSDNYNTSHADKNKNSSKEESQVPRDTDFDVFDSSEYNNIRDQMTGKDSVGNSSNLLAQKRGHGLNNIGTDEDEDWLFILNIINSISCNSHLNKVELNETCCDYDCISRYKDDDSIDYFKKFTINDKEFLGYFSKDDLAMNEKSCNPCVRRMKKEYDVRNSDCENNIDEEHKFLYNEMEQKIFSLELESLLKVYSKAREQRSNIQSRYDYHY